MLGKRVGEKNPTRNGDYEWGSRLRKMGKTEASTETVQHKPYDQANSQ